MYEFFNNLRNIKNENKYEVLKTINLNSSEYEDKIEFIKSLKKNMKLKMFSNLSWIKEPEIRYVLQRKGTGVLLDNGMFLSPSTSSWSKIEIVK